MDKFLSLQALSGLFVALAFAALAGQAFQKKWSIWGSLCLGFFGFVLLANGIAGTRELLPFALFILGLLLLVVEMALPGFSIPGIGGLLAIFYSLSLFMRSLEAALLSLLVTVLLVGAIVYYLQKEGKKPVYFDKFVLKNTPPVGRTDRAEGQAELAVGDLGKTLTQLRPSGFIEVDGKKYDAISDRGYIEKSCPVEVVAVQGKKILVRRK